ncbi:hypothetical protein [Mesorhizobium sp. ANAO-SY3R2]|uniref:hypothetical protein n=1 Tax=Mesorhizobium sp. ANAO-SY3R2 TaxID=3166644 RepID=UPI00366BCCE3
MRRYPTRRRQYQIQGGTTFSDAEIGTDGVDLMAMKEADIMGAFATSEAAKKTG